MVAQNGEILRSELWHLLCMCILYTYMCACELSAYIIYIYIHMYYLMVNTWYYHAYIHVYYTSYIIVYQSCVWPSCSTRQGWKALLHSSGQFFSPTGSWDECFVLGKPPVLLHRFDPSYGHQVAKCIYVDIHTSTVMYNSLCRCKEISVSTCIQRTYNVIKRIQTNHPLCKYIIYIHLDKYFWI